MVIERFVGLPSVAVFAVVFLLGNGALRIEQRSAVVQRVSPAAASAAIWADTGIIAFASNRDGDFEIYLMNGDGTNVRQLTDNSADDRAPEWSPDGSYITFVSDRDGRRPSIYVMDADGRNVRRLTRSAEADLWPSWSPDGDRIVFNTERDDNFEIYSIRADGTDLHQLTNTPGHEDFAVWSPDGSRIVFARIETNEGTFVINADGSGERRLLDFWGLEFDWSPDGTRIAFGSDHEGFRGIYVMDADGRNLRRLSQTRAGENGPAWSPDGTRIAFLSWRDGNRDIYLMDADGRTVRRLTDDEFEEGSPAWRPTVSH